MRGLSKDETYVVNAEDAMADETREENAGASGNGAVIDDAHDERLWGKLSGVCRASTSLNLLSVL